MNGIEDDEKKILKHFWEKSKTEGPIKMRLTVVNWTNKTQPDFPLNLLLDAKTGSVTILTARVSDVTDADRRNELAQQIQSVKKALGKLDWTS